MLSAFFCFFSFSYFLLLFLGCMIVFTGIQFFESFLKGRFLFTDLEHLFERNEQKTQLWRIKRFSAV